MELQAVTIVRENDEDLAVLTKDYVYYLSGCSKQTLDHVTTKGIFDISKLKEKLEKE